jgi:fused signal recognition particle receptor
MGLYERLRSRLSRTRETLSDGITAIFQGGRVIDQALLDELEELLYAADLGPVAARIVQEVGRLHRRGDVNGEAEVRSVLRETLLELVAPSGLTTGEIELAARPHVVLVVGVNGSGKTTTIAKLANRFQRQGKSVLLAACDTFRAAAAEQLEIWAERNGAPLVRGAEGADPASVAYDAVESAEVLGIDVVLVDTAGRLHTQKNLMQELSKVQRVIAKRLSGAPHDVWLVLDGTNGQNAIQQAREFLQAVGVSGLVITKLDGTARGGAVFSIVHMLGLPVRYIGTGETLEDIEPFEPRAFVDAVLSDVRAGARPGG